MSRNKVPRLSAHYEAWALYWFDRGMEHSVYFYLMAAWFYEDEDEKLRAKLNTDYLKEKQ